MEVGKEERICRVALSCQSLKKNPGLSGFPLDSQGAHVQTQMQSKQQMTHPSVRHSRDTPLLPQCILCTQDFTHKQAQSYKSYKASSHRHMLT